MPSSATSRNRFEKQGAGENSNTWGTKLNTTGLDLLDEAIDGVETIALTANLTLSTTNYATDQQRNKGWNFTGTGSYTVTIPATEQVKFVRNATTGTLTISNGTNSITYPTGKSGWLMSDGTNVWKDTSADDAATSATAADASADAAAVSETNAATSATNASNSATSASTSASNASTSASNAATSATLSSDWAQKTTGTVDGTGYSAKYWAQQAETFGDGTAYAQKANNLSDLTDAAAARTNLGLAIGTNVQAYDAQLQDLAGLSYTGNAGKAIKVNSAATGLEFGTAGGLSVGGFGGTDRYLSPITLYFSTNTIAVSANVLYAFPFTADYTIDALSFEVTTAGAASTVARVGIYSVGSDGLPGSLILDAGAIAVDTTGIKLITFATPYDVTTPVYVVIVTNGSPTLRACFSALASQMFGQSGFNGTASVSGYQVTFTYAALPATFPTGAGTTSAHIALAARID